MTLRKSGLRPNIPQVASIQILIISRRRIRSSTECGSINESPTGSPLDGDAKIICPASAGSCCMSKSPASVCAAPAQRGSVVTSRMRSPSMKICRSSCSASRNSWPVRMGMGLTALC
jgi:hypothetical protein